MTPERLAKFRELWDEHATIEEITVEMKISWRMARRIRIALGLAPRRQKFWGKAARVIQPEDESRFREVWANTDQYSLKDLQSIYECSDQCLYRAAKRLGLGCRYPIWSERRTQWAERQAEIARRGREGQSYRKIRAAMGTDWKTIRKAFLAHGVPVPPSGRPPKGSWPWTGRAGRGRSKHGRETREEATI